jgi:formate dehydrogenase major subunit
MSDPDQKHAREALSNLEHLVVQDIFLTETAWQADVVLPASAHAEKLGTYTNTNREVQLARPAVSLPGEARQDWELIQEIGKRIGLDWNYSHPREIYSEMAALMPSLTNISWERLEAEDAVTYPVDGPNVPGNEIMFSDSFPTKDGRARLVPAGLVPPDELPDETYPFVLTTGRLLEHWHTGAMTRRASLLDRLEPVPVALLNPRQLESFSLSPGDEVKVTTRRGSINIATRSDGQVPEGMIFIPFCFSEAAANLLTNPQLDPYGKIPEFKFCAARVESVRETTNVPQQTT